jgi:phospholipase C
MGYYTRSDLPVYYALADAFTLCDHYFCSVLSGTGPNRHYTMSATIDPAGRAGGPVVANEPDFNAIPPSSVVTNAAQYSWATMPERLQAQGVSWKIYQTPGSLASTMTNNILVRYKQYADPSSVLYRSAFLPIYPHDFVADIEAGTLPSVSWVLGPLDSDEAPPKPPNKGARVTAEVLRSLLRNPRVWAQTVFFVSYDENGGFFDHVAPPTPPPGTPDEFLAVDPLPLQSGGVSGPIGLGFRVPLLVISPFSRGGHINSDVADHTSLLRFLETRFGVEVPNLSAWRRSVTSDLTGTLDLSEPRLRVPALPSPLDDKLVARQCANITAAPPPHQQLPHQATRPRATSTPQASSRADDRRSILPMSMSFGAAEVIARHELAHASRHSP